jgi:hypothetical protein
VPQIGGVYVPDELMPTMQAPERPRPGFLDVLGTAAKTTFGQLRYGLPYQAAKLTGNLTPEDEARYQQGLAETAAASAAAPPAGVEDLTSGRVGFGRFVGENLAASLPFMAGSIVGGGLGYARGGAPGAVIGAIAAGTPQFSASNVARAVEEQGTLTEGAAARALAAAPIQSAADAAIARYLPGASKVLGDLASTQAGGFLRRTATSMVKAAGTEAVTEAAQQMGERYAAGMRLNDADAAGEYVNAAVTAAALGGVLGAGGGFRRTNAVAKPADMVTSEDITEHVDGMLNGSLRALPSPQSFGRAPGGPEVASGPAIEQDSRPHQLPDPDFIVDSEGRAVPPGFEGERALAIENNLPQTPGPTDAELLARINPPVEGTAAFDGTFAPPATDTSIAALSGPGFGAAPTVDVPAATRPLADVDIADLNKARKAKNADPAIVSEIEAEMAARDAENPFAGVPLNQDIAKLRNAAPEDQIAGVRALLEGGDSRAGTMKLAERLGIDLNTPAAPAAVDTAPIATTPEAAPASEPSPRMMPQAAPVDTEFRADWERLQKDAGIQRKRGGKDVLGFTPANMQQAQAQVFAALADDTSNAEVSQVEKMARKMGLITDDDAMDVTPLGRQTFLSTPEGFKETVSAARQQGYEGAQASVFDRGVRAQLAGEAAAPPFTDFSDMAAFQAGQVWAKDFVANADTRTAAQTEAIRARQEARTTGRPIERSAVRAELSPQQVQQRSLNQLLDAADMRGVSDSDRSMLRRMVVEGAAPADVGQALQRVQGGQTLFQQPPSTPARPSAQVSGRGQPIFKEMNTPERGPGRSAQRAETETAVQTYGLRREIERLRDSGQMQPDRADKLHDMLDEGKTMQVNRLLKIRQVAKDLNANVQDISGLVGDADPKFEAAIDGKSFTDIAKHMAEAAPSVYHREVMLKVRSLAQNLEKLGMSFDVRVLRPGDTGPRDMILPGTKAVTQVRYAPKPTARIYMNGSELGEQSAINYETMAHEMVHAVTMLQVAHGMDPKIYGKTELGKAVKNLVELQNAITDHFNARAQSGDLNDFERRFYDRDNNSLEDPDELLAWGMTNPEMQRYLNSVQFQPKQSVFSRLVAAVRSVLGMAPKYDGALAELLRVSEQVFATPRSELEAMLPRNNPYSNEETQVFSAAVRDGAAANSTAAAANDATQSFSGQAGAFVEGLNLRDKAARARRTMLGWLSHNQIDRQYGEQIPATLEHSDAHRERVAIRSRFEQMGEDAYQRFEQLEKANPKAAERMGQLMATTTEFRLDPEKTWDQHTWLTDDPNKANLQRLHGEAVKLANDLKRGDGAGWQAYQTFRHLNEAQNYARMAVGLHGLVATDPELSMGIENSWANPADQFMRAEGLDSATAIRDHWAQALDAQVAAGTAFVREKKGEAAQGTTRDQEAMSQHLSPIEMQIDAIHEAKAAMAKAPYFHLGRFGDNFGTAVIAKDKDGNVDPAKQAKVAKALEGAGFGDAQISTDSTKPRFMLRFDTVDQAMRFRQVALQLQQQGLLADDEIKVGPRNRTDNYGTAEGLPQFVASYIQNIEASPMFAADEGMTPNDRAALEKLKQDTIQLARDTWIESQPDNAISKMLVKRNTIPGYNKDMVRNFAHRWRVGSVNIANVASAPKFNKAFTNMRGQYNDALVANRKGPNGEALVPSDPFTVQDVMSELKLRDAKTPLDETADTFDKLRAGAHSYFLGFSPAYGMINMTQLGVTALPEMAKKHGYRSSFHAMRRASTQALAIVKAVGSEAGKLGWKHWGDVAITGDVLKKAGLDDKTRDFLQHMLATGTIDIGSMARSLGQVADNKGVGGGVDTYLKLSSAIGLYTETFSRLVTALAARELHGGYDQAAQDYAAKTVSESMFDYQNWNTARQLGKKGFLGPVTPLLTQFMSYQVQVTEKLYSEALSAFSKPRPGETAEQAKQRQTEARRFLAGHLAAVTALAGTLGLPFATVFATVIERMVDLLDDDDEPFDATSAYRNFLASVFGKDVAEVVARGLPRAAGFDISQRAGEQNLLPFSEFLADRRSWKEAVAGTAGRSIGAVPSMLMNIADGGGQIANGDLLGGMKTALPIAYKSPIEAYRMSEEGYIDTKGNKLPMTPTASSYLWQLLGFSPAEKAEYGEARGDQASRRGEITRRAGQLRQGIVRALRTGETEEARELIDEAIKFDQDNPGFAVLPSITASLQRQQQLRARTAQFGAPLGVTQRDVAGQALTQYANVGYAQ